MGAVIQTIAGIAVALAFLYYLYDAFVTKEKTADTALIRKIVFIGLAVLLGLEVVGGLSIGADGMPSGSGLLSTIIKAIISLAKKIAAQAYLVPTAEPAVFVRAYVTPKITRVAEVVIQICGQAKLYFAA